MSTLPPRTKLAPPRRSPGGRPVPRPPGPTIRMTPARPSQPVDGSGVQRRERMEELLREGETAEKKVQAVTRLPVEEEPETEEEDDEYEPSEVEEDESGEEDEEKKSVKQAAPKKKKKKKKQKKAADGKGKGKTQKVKKRKKDAGLPADEVRERQEVQRLIALAPFRRVVRETMDEVMQEMHPSSASSADKALRPQFRIQSDALYLLMKASAAELINLFMAGRLVMNIRGRSHDNATLSASDMFVAAELVYNGKLDLDGFLGDRGDKKQLEHDTLFGPDSLMHRMSREECENLCAMQKGLTEISSGKRSFVDGTVLASRMKRRPRKTQTSARAGFGGMYADPEKPEASRKRKRKQDKPERARETTVEPELPTHTSVSGS